MKSLTLTELFQNYFKTEQITDMKCENCSKQNVIDTNAQAGKKGFIKKLAIAKLPETLCLQIQRNSWSGLNDEMIKQSNYVQFPLNIKIDNPVTELNNNHVYNKTIYDLNLNSSFSLKQVGLGCLLGGNKINNTKHEIKQQTNAHEILPVNNNNNNNSNNNTKHQFYELKSAIVHYGNAVSGHFVSFRQSLIKDKEKQDDWLQISDSDIKTCKQYNLLSSNVYMLFYDKVVS
jgi:ubiquitin C-terminal hydrolase